jgi:hypothetical protein
LLVIVADGPGKGQWRIEARAQFFADAALYSELEITDRENVLADHFLDGAIHKFLPFAVDKAWPKSIAPAHLR